ncbi:MAG: CZB domain-containing protein, partial [Planctomycetes bacterium]|nr:CZB domain-containing protein [Planctomycetota bacterium]
MKIRTKLMTSYIVIAVLCAVVGGVALYVSSQFAHKAQQAMEYTNLVKELKEREIDHLKWMKKVEDLFVENQSGLEVQTDDHLCHLGKFLYDGRLDEMRTIDPEIVEIFDGMKDPHARLHQSADQISEYWCRSHPGLIDTLRQRLDDHRKWASSVANALLQNQPIQVQTDPTLCAFGKWLGCEDCGKLCQEWSDFGGFIDRIKPYHHDLHQSVLAIEAAETVEEKVNIYQERTLAKLDQIDRFFTEVIKLEEERVHGQEKSHEVFSTLTIPAMYEVQGAMTQAMNLAEEKKKDLS